MPANRLQTAAASQAVSVSTARDYCQVTHRDDDRLIAELIAAATRWIESRYLVAVMSQTWTLTLDDFTDSAYVRDGDIVIGRQPFGAVTSLTYIDSAGASQTLGASAYRVTPTAAATQISPAYGTSWPQVYCVPGAVSLVYTVGAATAADVSPVVTQAILSYVLDRFENREEALAEHVVMGMDAQMSSTGARSYG